MTPVTIDEDVTTCSDRVSRCECTMPWRGEINGKRFSGMTEIGPSFSAIWPKARALQHESALLRTDGESPGRLSTRLPSPPVLGSFRLAIDIGGLEKRQQRFVLFVIDIPLRSHIQTGVRRNFYFMGKGFCLGLIAA